MMRAPRTDMLIALVLSLVAAADSPHPLGAASGQQDTQQPATTIAPSPPGMPASLEEAQQLEDQANAHIASRAFDEAVRKIERALALRRQHLGEMHADVARSIGRLGFIAYQQGQFAIAEGHFREALRIREATLGPDHLDVAESLDDTASMLLLRGDYVGPEPLFLRALAIYERAAASAGGPAKDRQVQERTAGVLNNLALLHNKKNDYGRAESLYLRVLAIRRRVGAPDEAGVAAALANLGGLYYTAGEYEKAAHALQGALEIQEKHLPPTHPSLATSSFNLAAVHFDNGDYGRAGALFRRALAIDEGTLDPQHPRLATRLFGLAEVLRLTGAYTQADALYARALTIRERSLGPSHPDVATTLIARALVRFATGDFGEAAEMLSKGTDLREEMLALVLTSGSEDQKRLFLGRLADETDIAVSLHLGASQTPAAARLALSNVLQRKGRSIDATADHMATLRVRLDDTDREVLARLTRSQSELAAMVLRGAADEDQRRRIVALRADLERLEQLVSSRSAEFRVASAKAGLSDILQALPARAALIEFAAYRPFFVRNARPTAFGAARYAAYVVRPDGVAAGVDIGDAASIDSQVARFRRALSNPDDGQVREIARALEQAVMAPLRASLSEVDHIIVSPDGALNLVPFAALVGEDDKYLVERFTISYVTSGRDLARVRALPGASRAATSAAVVADPAFDHLPVAATTLSDHATATRALDALVLDQALVFRALPGTADEAADLAKVLPEARVYTGANATEALVKQLRGPSILHVATHGFFLRPSPARRPRIPGEDATASPPAPRADREDALVLSGLALAGANQRWSGEGEDGILTALEAAGLDLWGTRMVVLSACETGVGDARNGEGVYGLRRALVLAGSESQVMSLWKVADEATRDLMVAYYQRLRSGQGRADALRDVQLAFLRGVADRVHPYYWASFIQSGDWRSVLE